MLFSSDEIVASEVNESNQSNDFHNTVENRDAINNCDNFMEKKLCYNHDEQNSNTETNVLEKFIRNILIHEGFDLCDFFVHLMITMGAECPSHYWDTLEATVSVRVCSDLLVC